MILNECNQIFEDDLILASKQIKNVKFIKDYIYLNGEKIVKFDHTFLDYYTPFCINL